jgi:protein-export membrane protein SecD
MLTIFKLIPVTLTAAGIAGFILSIGMAVDANILIFERIKEELGGKTLEESIRTGFARAWLSIRDSNISSIITAIILFWFGTSLVKGFALTFGLGVLISMITAITISRTLLLSVGSEKYLKLFNSGVK